MLIGKLSYSLYLWHWPLIVMGREGATLGRWTRSQGTYVGLSLAVVVAALLYRFVERPFRERGPGRARRLAVLGAAFVLCAGTCFALSLRALVADPDRIFDRPSSSSLSYSFVPEASIAEELRAQARYYDLELAPASSGADPSGGGIIHDWGRGPPRVVLLGSSHAMMYGRLVDEICAKHGWTVAFLVATGTPAIEITPGVFETDEEARRFEEARRHWLAEWKPDALLVVDRWDVRCREETRAQFETKVRRFVDDVGASARNVIFLSQPPGISVGNSVNLREYVASRFRATGSLPTLVADSQEPNRCSAVSAFERVAHEVPRVELLRVDQCFHARDGAVRYCSGRRFFYVDGNHLTDQGADETRELCERALVAACAR